MLWVKLDSENRSHVASVLLLAGVVAVAGIAWTTPPVASDPLIRMPGSQQGSVAIEDAGNCLGCHGGPDNPSDRLKYLSPGFRWQGSMMGQAARDPLFFACFTVAAQDSAWAIGTPNAADLCMRCHFPMGWLGGRSDPPNASRMTGGDYDGVQCDFCHRLVDPFFDATYDGEREGASWSTYWDEANATTPGSIAAATATWNADVAQSAAFLCFNGTNFYGADHRPISPTYTEAGAGQYYVTAENQRMPRAPFADPGAKHSILYSRFHKSKYACATCHDVSNPVLANLGADTTACLPTETNSAALYFHVERTFSEFMCSGYGAQGGMTGTGAYAPALFETSRPGNVIATCQDCHMPDGYGRGCNKSSGVVRKDESLEHLESGQPRHDLTGGNLWIPYLLASTDPTSPNYDSFNEARLWQGPAALTLDLSQGVTPDPVALLDAAARAAANLEAAASITNLTYNPLTGACTFQVVNHTGHRLLSGFPEGRRMFVTLRAYVGDALVYELNPYDSAIGTLKGLPKAYSAASPPLTTWEQHLDSLVYEIHPSSALTGEDSTFHFVLATGRSKDNRIPPRGYDIEQAVTRLCEPVWHGASDTNYYTAAEYAGGYDAVALQLPAGVEKLDVQLYYQTTSREYVEFLRDEINGTADSLPVNPGDPSPYIIQTNSWFAQLKAWGDTLWELWEHNKQIPGAAPIPMTDLTLELDDSDEDFDGIPAYWETLFFGGPTNALATADSDLDGIDNHGEYLAYTWPTDSNSVLRIEALAITATNGSTHADVAFSSSWPRLYALQYATNLAPATTWLNVVTNAPGTGAMTMLCHSNSADALTAMYRLTVRLP